MKDMHNTRNIPCSCWFVFHKTAFIIAIKGNEGVFDVYICHKCDLFFKRRGFVVPFFDNYGI